MNVKWFVWFVREVVDWLYIEIRDCLAEMWDDIELSWILAKHNYKYDHNKRSANEGNDASQT